VHDPVDTGRHGLITWACRGFESPSIDLDVGSTGRSDGSGFLQFGCDLRNRRPTHPQQFGHCVLRHQQLVVFDMVVETQQRRSHALLYGMPRVTGGDVL
jgi:hypothetical protein